MSSGRAWRSGTHHANGLEFAFASVHRLGGSHHDHFGGRHSLFTGLGVGQRGDEPRHRPPVYFSAQVGLVRRRFCSLLSGGIPGRDPEIGCCGGFFFGDCRTDGGGAHLGFHWRIWCYPDFPQHVSRFRSSTIAYRSNPDSKTMTTLLEHTLAASPTRSNQVSASFSKLSSMVVVFWIRASLA